MIEVVGFVEQREGRDGGAKFLTDDVVRSPEPVRGEYLIASLDVVVDGSAQSSRSTCRCDSGEIARRTIAGKCNINRCLEILRKSRDRRIGDIVGRCASLPLSSITAPIVALITRSSPCSAIAARHAALAPKIASFRRRDAACDAAI